MRLRAAARAIVLAGALVVTLASPASAHGTAQVPATDYDVQVRSITPAVAGLHVRSVDDGNRVELDNDTGREVIVLGYDNEPYLRVGPKGVWRNRRSPAVYWNRQQNQQVITSAPPAGYDASKPPVWQHISGGHVTRWHDHRVHYQGSAPGGRARIVLRWELPLREGGRTLTVAGDVRYIPPPSPAPYLLFAALVAIGLCLAARTKRWPTVLMVALTLLIAAAALQLVGEWGATTLSLPSRIGEHVYVFAGIALGIGALVWLVVRRARPYDATPIALLAGVALLLASGLTGLPLLAHSLLPSTLPAGFVRVLVATTIGAGIAVVVITATKLRRPFEPRAGYGRDDQESSSATAILRSM
jgi:hypothetical protein